MAAFCGRCDRWFGSQRALEQHKDDSPMHYMCHECNKDFASWGALKQHQIQSPRHPACVQCRTTFDDWDELYEHYDDEHYYCDSCNDLFAFASEQGLHEHRRKKHANRYCPPCKRIFKDANSLDNHCRSSIHQGRNVDCPMRGCEKSFVSTAGLLHHLESGACVSRMTRATIDRIMIKYDRDHLITNPSRLIGGGPGGATVVDQWATERAWNGMRYECYLCHRTYATLPALNQHLQSPAHAEKLYRCPRALYGCGAEFRTLSAFCQHVESERCGVRRFRGEVDRVLEGLSSKMKRLTMG